MWWCSLAVVLVAATCSAGEAVPWWRTATFYEVFPRSFKDSDGDGTGDLRGIIQNAEYFKELGLDAIWLTPFYKSPMIDFGYDISNFTTIEPVFGTMDDFDQLAAKMKSLGIKLVVDFVPNHTSDEHVWFQYSVNTSHPLHQHYRDFYVWHDANGTTPEGDPILPNNWWSVFGGPAWSWSDQRQQFYLHQFDPKQPDLNFRNPNVVENMTAIMNFWLDKGIDGFRVDAADHLFEDATFANEKPYPGTPGDNWFNTNHTSMINQPETFQLLKVWADLLYERGLRDGKDLAMFMEVYASLDISMKYYGTGNDSLEIPFNFWFFMAGSKFSTPYVLKFIINQWLAAMPNDSAPNWVVGNHDWPRLPDKYGPEMVDAINLVTGVLPGLKIAYYGEEIGMANTPISFNQTVDPWAKNMGPVLYQYYSRDFGRTPMQWDNTPNAGFSNASKTWLPVNPNYWTLNVAAQRAAPTSHLKVFQAMTEARKDPILLKGDLKLIIPENNNDTFVVVRSLNESLFALIMNMGSYPATYTSQNLFASSGLDQDLTTVVGSINSGYMPGVTFKKGSQNITLRPKAAILLRSGTSHDVPSASSTLLISKLMVVILLFITCGVFKKYSL